MKQLIITLTAQVTGQRVLWNEEQIYLSKKKKRNEEHIELFSLWLAHRTIKIISSSSPFTSARGFTRRRMRKLFAPPWNAPASSPLLFSARSFSAVIFVSCFSKFNQTNRRNNECSFLLKHLFEDCLLWIVWLELKSILCWL